MPFDRYDYDNTVPLADRAERSPFKELTRRTPDRMGNALILLVFVVGATFIAWICFLIMGVEDPGGHAGTFGIVVLTAAVVVVFFSPHVLQTLEKATGWDLDRDGHVGKVPVERKEVHITLSDERAPNQYARFEIKESLERKLPLVCRRIVDGTPFSETGMTSSKLLTKGEFGTLRDILFTEALCVWKDPQVHTLGVKFTGRGNSFLRHYASQYYDEISTSTTPTRTLTPGVLDMPSRPALGEGKEES